MTMFNFKSFTIKQGGTATFKPAPKHTDMEVEDDVIIAPIQYLPEKHYAIGSNQRDSFRLQHNKFNGWGCFPQSLKKTKGEVHITCRAAPNKEGTKSQAFGTFVIKNEFIDVEKDPIQKGQR